MNKYGHLHQVKLDTLKKNNVTAYRTDLNGTIVATSDGKNVTIKTSNTVAQATINKALNSTTGNKNSTTPTTTNSNTSAENTSSTNNKSQTVYITKTGEKYHQDGCSSLSKSKIAISLSDAEAKGYEPCSKCCK